MKCTSFNGNPTAWNGNNDLYRLTPAFSYVCGSVTYDGYLNLFLNYTGFFKSRFKNFYTSISYELAIKFINYITIMNYLLFSTHATPNESNGSASISKHSTNQFSIKSITHTSKKNTISNISVVKLILNNCKWHFACTRPRYSAKLKSSRNTIGSVYVMCDIGITKSSLIKKY